MRSHGRHTKEGERVIEETEEARDVGIIGSEQKWSIMKLPLMYAGNIHPAYPS